MDIIELRTHAEAGPNDDYVRMDLALRVTHKDAAELHTALANKEQVSFQFGAENTIKELTEEIGRLVARKGK